MKGVRRGLKSRQQRDQLATLDRGSGENVGSTCRELPRGLSPGPTCVPEARELSARLARLSLPYLSSDRAKSRRSPSTSVESFLTVRALGFPREFGFGVRRRGVVVSGLGTVRISVGTPSFPAVSSLPKLLLQNFSNYVYAAAPSGTGCSSRRMALSFILGDK